MRMRGPYDKPYYKIATVFGGSGFIGRYVVRDLAKRGWRVRVACRNPDEALFLKPMGSVGQIVPVPADIRADVTVAAAVQDADYVVNLVGILYEHGRVTFDAIHHEGARRIAVAAAAAGCSRLVQISALGASVTSDSRYARTKGLGEQAVLAAFPGATILRPSIVFGPEDSFFNRFAAMARIAPALPLIGGGRTKFQPVYVGDVADAVTACLDRLETRGQTFELGGPKVYSFRELMEILLKEINRKRMLVPVPWPVARLMGSVFGVLPKPLLTRDQVVQLRQDNVVSRSARGFKELGIDPHAVELILPTYLDRFKVGGRYSRRRPTTGVADMGGG